MKKALSCQTPGRALPPPRAVPQRHGGRVPRPDRSVFGGSQSVFVSMWLSYVFPRCLVLIPVY